MFWVSIRDVHLHSELQRPSEHVYLEEFFNVWLKRIQRYLVEFISVGIEYTKDALQSS